MELMRFSPLWTPVQVVSPMSSGAQWEKSPPAIVLALGFPSLCQGKCNRCKWQDPGPDEDMKKQESTWHLHVGWYLSSYCSLWTANQWSLERDSGNAEIDTWYCVAFPHKQISRAAWDSLWYLAWLAVATPEGSRRLSIGYMSYLPVPCGLVLLNVLGCRRCLVTFKLVMSFVKKGARSIYRSKNLLPVQVKQDYSRCQSS